MSHRSPFALALALTLACVARPSGNDESADESSDESSGASESSSETDTLPPADLPPPFSCSDECEPDEICVMNCARPDFGPEMIVGSRCVAVPECIEFGSHSAPCVEIVCGDPYAQTGCFAEGTSMYDLVCATEYWQTPCDTDEGCPRTEKCVPQVPDEWGLWPTRCLGVMGSGAPGDPCTSVGATPGPYFVDDCGETSLCWSGMLSPEPFEGTCHAYCVDGACDPGSTCTEIQAGFELCVPD